MLVSLFSATGCVSYVFKEPATVSTRSEVIKHVKPIREISVEYTNYIFVIIPIMPDPGKVYEDLMAEAKKAGGNAVVDIQVRPKKSGLTGFLPVFMSVTFEAVGTAAVIE